MSIETRVIPTSIATGYVADWTPVQAVREVFQNYLDIVEEQQVKGTVTWKDGQVIVEDKGPGLAMRHFALGISEKGSENAKGQFGEGLKLGLMALARQGRSCTLLSNGRQVEPIIQVNPDYEVETLHLRVSSSRKRVGTEIRVECSKEEYDAARQYFVELADGITWVDRECGISMPAGHIYLNGTHVGSPHMLFSYHLSTRDVEGLGQVMNRDRSVVDTTKLASVVLKKVCATRSAVVARRYLQMLHNPDVDQRPLEGQAYVGGYMLEDRALWKAQATAEFGEGVLHSSHTEKNSRAEYLGYKVLYVSSYSLREILSSLGWQTVDRVLQDVPVEYQESALTPEEDAILQEACAVVREVLADPQPVIVCDFLRVNGSEVSGAYLDPNILLLGEEQEDLYGITMLHRDRLESLGEAVATLLHETLHATSESEDLSEHFQAAYTDLAGDLACRYWRASGH